MQTGRAAGIAGVVLVCLLAHLPSAGAKTDFAGDTGGPLVRVFGTRSGGGTHNGGTGNGTRGGNSNTRTPAKSGGGTWTPPAAWARDRQVSDQQWAACREVVSNACASWDSPQPPQPGLGQPPAQQGPTIGDVIGAAQQEMARIPIPEPTAHIQPGGGTVLVRMPTNFYLDKRATVRNITVLGIVVTVSIYPDTFTWDTGDDSQIGPTTDPGGAYPYVTTAHTYTKQGSYPITLTTTYTATLTIPGYGTLELPGRGETVQDVGTLTAKTARTRMVAPDRQ